MTSPDILRELERLRQALSSLRSQVPVRFGSGPASLQFGQIISGVTLATGQAAITWAASVTPTQLYDPDVDTSYTPGLGNCWVFNSNGIPVNRALLVHTQDFGDGYRPLLAGRRVRLIGTTTLTVSGGPDDGQEMTAYIPGWE